MEVRLPAAPVFELIKWYADAVSAAGDYWIGYSARLRIGRFSAGYSSVLHNGGERHSLQPCAIAEIAGGVFWRLPALGIAGNWRGTGHPIRRLLYEDAEGAVDWECLLPSASAETGGVTGLGYVERLRLTIAPWRLPIRRLRWGRFLSARNSLVWIDWEGDFNSRSVFRNGDPVAAARIDDDGLLLEGGVVLRFDRGLVIRRGPLGSTVLAAVPGLDRFAPMRMLQVEERKWRSAAILETPGAPADRGWAIHEAVTWP
jgi:hypothetical protein